MTKDKIIVNYIKWEINNFEKEIFIDRINFYYNIEGEPYIALQIRHLYLHSMYMGDHFCDEIFNMFPDLKNEYSANLFASKYMSEVIKDYLPIISL